MVKDPFATITKKNGTASSKTTKIAATVNNKIKETVDTVITLKAKIKQLKVDQDLNEQTIIEHVLPQQELQARQGNYSKSFYVEGKTGSLTYTTTDKFTIDKDENIHETIQNLLGKDFDKYVKYARIVTLKDKVQQNTTLINKIIKAVTDTGLKLDEAFEVEDVLITQPDVDKLQFELPPDILAEFRTLIKQNKPSLK